MPQEKLNITPQTCLYTDSVHTKLIIEVILPGVKKENIKLKMHDDSFYLFATREDINFVVTTPFCCPVNPEYAKAIYDNGLLKIDVPFKESMDDAITIPIE